MDAHTLMSGIFGVIHLDGSPVPEEELSAMRAAMQEWGPDRSGVWQQGSAGLGSQVLYDTPEAMLERLPLQSQQGFVLTAEARLDNRGELCGDLRISAAEARGLADGHLIQRAYEKWGEDAPPRLIGDWSFAAWHPREGRLFLARDHYGNTALYYFQDERRFAFASSRKALFALGVPRRLNEFFLACVLISWTAHHGEQTIELDLRRLAPAHTLRLAGARQQVRQYWRLEDTPVLRLGEKQEYIERFLSIYDRAVRDRLRSSTEVGVTLSGGLDSGSVTALAARALSAQKKRLTGYTSVPASDVSHTVDGDRFGDELPFARASASFAGNVDLIEIRSSGLTPIQGIRRGLEIHAEPGHAAANLFWITALLDRAHRDGVRTLLSGQGGNATVSWTGMDRLRILRQFARAGRWGRVLQQLTYPYIPAAVLREMRHLLHGDTLDWSHTAIHPDFARRIGLAHQYIEGTGSTTNPEDWQTGLQERYAILKPGQSFLGSIWAENSAAHGLDVRDPTVDKRVMEFTLSIPDREFSGPDGFDRWIIRAAMKDIMPDGIRLNRRRGRQAADLGQRLVDSSEEVDEALQELDASPMAREHLSLVRMQEVWRSLRQRATSQNTHQAVTILARGIMAGLYLADLERESS
jgi:asparagine synthase (glutamine-hydrolysing)